MGTYLYVDATESAVEKFFNVPAGSISEVTALRDKNTWSDEDVDAIERHPAYDAHNLIHGNGLGKVHFANDEHTYSGGAKGREAVRVVLRQRGKEWGDARYNREHRQLCDRVALAIADGRFQGVHWT